MSDDDENDYEDYESGPFCIHFCESGMCDEICEKCGHSCNHHFCGDECNQCDCKKFKTKGGDDEPI